MVNIDLENLGRYNAMYNKWIGGHTLAQVFVVLSMCEDKTAPDIQ